MASLRMGLVLIILIPFWRFKIFRKIDNKYARGVRRAHKIHHKNINKEGGECFGMLFVPKKYFK